MGHSELTVTVHVGDSELHTYSCKVSYKMQLLSDPVPLLHWHMGMYYGLKLL